MKFSNELLKNLLLLCKEFNNKQIEYALVGGLAVGIISQPRATEDIDLLIMLEAKNKNFILNILEKKFNIVNAYEKIMNFKNASIWRIIIESSNKNLIVIDFLFSINEIYKNALINKQEIVFEKEKIYIVKIEDLILIKLLSSRKIDEIDVSNLIETNIEDLNIKYLKKYIDKFNLNIDFLEDSFKKMFGIN